MFLHQLLLPLTTLFFYTTHNALCDQLYDSTKEVCCNGTVYVKPLNETNGYSCCGSQLLLNGKGVCCDNTIIPYKHNVTGEYDDWRCCKSGDQVTLYNHQTQRCCLGNIIDVGDNCNLECCGNTTFDYRKGKCCNNVVHNTGYPSRYSCCGNTAFEYSKEICCYNIVHITNDPLKFGCCGDNHWPDESLDTNDPFKSKPEFKLHPLPDYAEARYDHGCCGLEIYNSKSEACCGGVLHRLPANPPNYGCCGTKLIIDKTKEICCPGDVVRARDNNHQLCCGEGLYDRDKEYCCGSHVISKSANVSCCWDLGIGYNPTTNVCCGNAVLPKPIDYGKTSSTTRCCRRYKLPL